MLYCLGKKKKHIIDTMTLIDNNHEYFFHLSIYGLYQLSLSISNGDTVMGGYVYFLSILTG